VSEAASTTATPTADGNGPGDHTDVVPSGEPRSIALARWALPALLVLTVVVFSLLKPETFMTVANFKTVAQQQSVLAILAVAALLPLIIGAFDVSVAANLGLGAILATGLASKQGLPAGAAVATAVAVCTLIGFVNGSLIAGLQINPFIATLGMSTILTGATLWYANGSIIFENIPQSLINAGQKDLLGLPLPVVYLVVVVAIAWFVTEFTPLGRYLFAVGGSFEAARLSGLNVRGLTLLTFTLSGFLAGIAGVVQAAQLGSGNPTVGPSFLLPAFAAAFLGATTLKVGTFNVPGTIIAVFFLALGVNGLELNGVPAYVEPVFNGAALIVGVAFVRLLRREAVT
jgi:ribose transport system permease protein